MTPADEKAAKQWAIKALTRRMHTVREIEKGLSRRGWDTETIRGVLDNLRSLGYLDDAKFAEVWVATRSDRRLHGPLRLLADLRARGVEDETAEAAVRTHLPASKEVDLARRAAARKKATLRDTGIRASAAMHRHLMSRGFSPGAIREALADIRFEEEES